MTEDPQLSLLTAGGDPRAWPCPTCSGRGVRAGEPGQAPAKCRVCMGAGTVPYDPTDKTFGY